MPATAVESRPTQALQWRGLTAWGCALVLLVVGAWAGMKWQHLLWDATQPVRFTYDINNAYYQGQRAQQIGVFNVYRWAAENARDRGDGSLDYDLDYPPLRLVVAWAWTGWTNRHFGPVRQWQNTWEFHEPLMLMNRTYLAIAALSAMGLVVHFRRLRGAGLQPATPTLSVAPLGRGAISGVVAFLLAWFCLPAGLIGFGWPQWDICVPAFFLAALLAGCRRWWIAAGALLAIGGMYKGQVLISLPVFVLWPIVAGQWRGLVRMALGFVLAAGAITAPFMFQNTLWAVGTLAGMLVAIVGLGVIRRGTSGWWWLLILVAGAAAWPASRTGTGALPIVPAVGIAAVLFALAALLPRKDLPSVIVAALAAGIWLPACFTPEPWDWLDVGLLYGTHHFQAMTMGMASTFPAILAAHFDISNPNIVAFTLAEYDVTWKVLLRTIFIGGMVLCGVAMGIHDRRANPRFLLAAITPWVLFATIPAQIHERYAMYPAMASVVLIALGFRWTLVHLCLAAIAAAIVLHAQLVQGQHFMVFPRPGGLSVGTQVLDMVQATRPDIAWALVALCGICLWCALDIRRPRAEGYPQTSTDSHRS